MRKLNAFYLFFLILLGGALPLSKGIANFAVAGLYLTWIVSLFVDSDSRRLPSCAIPMILFGYVLVLSIFLNWPEHQHRYEWRDLRYYFFVFPLYAAFRKFSWSRSLVWVLAVSSCIVGILGCLEHYGIFLLASSAVEHPLTHESFRATAFSYHPTVYATMMICFFSFFLAATFFNKGMLKRRFVLIGVTLLIFFGIFASYTRAAWLSSILIFFIVVSVRSRRFLWGALLTVILFCIVGAAISPDFRWRIRTIWELTTLQDRVANWKFAFQLFKENPFWGIGYENFPSYENRFQTLYPSNIFLSHPHNFFLNVLGSMGGVGLLAFLAVLVQIGRTLLRGLKTAFSTRDKAIVVSSLATFFGVLLMNMVDDQLGGTSSMYFWFFVTWGLAVVDKNQDLLQETA